MFEFIDIVVCLVGVFICWLVGFIVSIGLVVVVFCRMVVVCVGCFGLLRVKVVVCWVDDVFLL